MVILAHITNEMVSNTPVATYDPNFFAPLFAMEDRHFWFRARNKLVAELLCQITANFPVGYRVLEPGCGTGNTLRILEQGCVNGLVIGMDLFREGLCYAHLRTSCPLVQAELHHLPFGEAFNLICLFDVLEHLPDDWQTLKDLHAMLEPGGSLFLTVPAQQSLWSYFDEVARHCRRYDIGELTEKLVETGYKVEYITYYMASLFPLVWAGRRIAAWLNKARKNSENDAHELSLREFRIIPIINPALAFILAQENRLLARRYSLPFGTSLLVIAHRE